MTTAGHRRQRVSVDVRQSFDKGFLLLIEWGFPQKQHQQGVGVLGVAQAGQAAIGKGIFRDALLVTFEGKFKPGFIGSPKIPALFHQMFYRTDQLRTGIHTADIGGAFHVPAATGRPQQHDLIAVQHRARLVQQMPEQVVTGALLAYIGFEGQQFHCRHRRLVRRWTSAVVVGTCIHVSHASLPRRWRLPQCSGFL